VEKPVVIKVDNGRYVMAFAKDCVEYITGKEAAKVFKSKADAYLALDEICKAATDVNFTIEEIN
jgi:hypothetical protein